MNELLKLDELKDELKEELGELGKLDEVNNELDGMWIWMMCCVSWMS